MVRLQKRFAYTYPAKQGAIEHYKHQIVIPEQTVKELGWEEGQELELTTEQGALIVKPQESRRRRSNR